MRPGEAVVDGEVVGRSTPNLGKIVALGPDGAGPVEAQNAITVITSDQRARMITLFLRIPLFAAIALHHKVPPLLRLGAGALAIWDLGQIAGQQKKIEEMLPEGY
jgi:hypothetical protein